ncbi:hypothetical protein OAZ88_00605 [bacterium]|nr:hypothetical protein [bacterium]
MILFVSTLSPKDGDIEFFRNFENRLHNEPVFYWGGLIPGTPNFRKFPLPWNLSTLPRLSSRQHIPTFQVYGHDWFDKYTHRLALLAGQNFDKLSAAEVVNSLITTTHILLAALKPRLLIAHNPLIPHTGIPFDIAQSLGLPVLTIERGPLPSTMWLDEHGYGGWSRYCGKTLESMFRIEHHQELEKVGSECIKLGNSIHTPRGATVVSHEPSKERLPVETLRPRILILGMADVNTAIFPSNHQDKQVNSPCFDSSSHLAFEVSKCSVGTVVFKPHPNCYHLDDMQRFAEAGIFVSGLDVEELLNWADIVITNGSSLEFQAHALRKPVVLAGRTIISGKAISYEVSEQRLLKREIRAALSRKNMQIRSTRFQILIGGLIQHHFIDSFAREWPVEPARLLSARSWNPLMDLFDYIYILRVYFCFTDGSYLKVMVGRVRKFLKSIINFIDH